jgi:hypothetical protein
MGCIFVRLVPELQPPPPAALWIPTAKLLMTYGPPESPLAEQALVTVIPRTTLPSWY